MVFSKQPLWNRSLMFTYTGIIKQYKCTQMIQKYFVLLRHANTSRGAPAEISSGGLHIRGPTICYVGFRLWSTKEPQVNRRDLLCVRVSTRERQGAKCQGGGQRDRRASAVSHWATLKRQPTRWGRESACKGDDDDACGGRTMIGRHHTILVQQGAPAEIAESAENLHACLLIPFSSEMGGPYRYLPVAHTPDLPLNAN